MSRRNAVLAAIAVVLASACSGSGHHLAQGTVPLPTSTSVPASTTPAPTPAALSWKPCGTGLECATLPVPLDYAHPGGRQVGLALERHRATGPGRIGSLLLNPGGPGETGVGSMSLFMSILSPAIQSHFDLLAFDPRGVGQSDGVECLNGPQLDHYYDVDPVPRTQAQEQAIIDLDRQFVAGCQAHSGDLLPFVGTVNAARDMDLIRQAVGDAKLTYLGFSYGSLLGTVYAGLFPTHIRALTVDGALDPALDPVVATDQQSAALDHALTDFFTYCTSTPSCAWKPGANPRAAFDSLMTSIRNHPLSVGARTVGAGEAFVGVVAPLYSRDSWPDLAIALQRAFEGDGSVLLQFFDVYSQRRPDGTYPVIASANTAVNCADQAWPTDLSVYAGLASAAAAQAPEFGVANLYSGVLCSVWPFRTTQKPGPITAAGSPPIVVVGSTHDPITPYSWAQALAHELQHGVLLTRVGEGHAAYQFSACIRGYVDAYLINLTVPPAATTCSS